MKSKSSCETAPVGACVCGAVQRNRERWEFADAWISMRGDDVRARRELARRAGVPVQSLKVYAWVARRIADELRVAHIEWSHFQIIAATPVRDRPTWVAMVEADQLSVRQLRTRIVRRRFGLPVQSWPQP